jgi:3-hydroxyacyl-CoA dehydrogenase
MAGAQRMMIPDRELFRSADTRCRVAGDAALVLSLEQPRPNISSDVLDALARAVEAAETGFATLVITAAGKHFAFGAPLTEAFAALREGRPAALDAALEHYQRTMLRLRHARVPTIAAVRGVAVSGACELLMHCTRVVAAPRSHIGLAEPSVGVIPGGGGLKELALRAAASGDPIRAIVRAFETVATSTISTTAEHAQVLGFLSPEDRVRCETEPWSEAVEVGLALHAAGHAPPPENPSFAVSGTEVCAMLRAAQLALLEKGEITPHQLEINARVAEVLCGGGAAGIRSEADLLARERMHFVALAQMPLTQQRLEHLRHTGNVLIN